MNNYTYIKAMLLSSCCAASSVFALEIMDEQSLSEQTAQDGLSVIVNPMYNGNVGSMNVGYANYIDRNGLNAADGLALTPNVTDAALGIGGLRMDFGTDGTGVVFKNASGGGVANPFALALDANGANASGGNVLIARFTTDKSQYLTSGTNDLDTIEIRLSSIKLLAGDARVQRDFIKVNSPIKLKLAANKPINIDMQLGNTSTSNGLINLRQVEFASIDMGVLNVLNSVADTAANTNTFMKTSMKMTDVVLSGLRADVDSTGLVVTHKEVGGAISVGKVEIGRSSDTACADTAVSSCGIYMGNDFSSQSGTVFNGLKNGSMGHVVLNNVTVTNPKITIAGL